jgi:putative Mg2+ transporter-C (MgtC) family protein
MISPVGPEAFMGTEFALVPRLVAAVAIGAVLGWERQSRHKPAGIRTHALVTLACALLIAFSQLLVQRAPAGSGNDGRIVQGILAGIGFIGAGTILRQGTSVSGLTTAGTIWMAAALGIVVGGGFYILAAAGLVLSLIVVDVLGWLERRLTRDELTEELEARMRDVRQRDEIIAALTQRRPGSYGEGPGH